MRAYLTENCPKLFAGLDFVEYDPGLEDFATLPDRQFDLIISADVLEHVEPEMIEDTIRWMQDHADRALYHHIACDPAGITLPDGRNAHILCRKLDWWMEKFTHSDWQWMIAADMWQQKRKYFRNHCQVLLEKVPGAPAPQYVPADYQA
jgi:hypothetical protein